MKQTIKHAILICLGWCMVILGIIGVFLPILPTTPFMILALYLFSKSSERFHQMLLHNRWFGPGLQQWERDRSVTPQTKKRACTVIVITFAVSIAILAGRLHLQLMLVFICLTLLAFMWRLTERENTTPENRMKEEHHA